MLYYINRQLTLRVTSSSNNIPLMDGIIGFHFYHVNVIWTLVVWLALFLDTPDASHVLTASRNTSGNDITTKSATVIDSSTSGVLKGLRGFDTGRKGRLVSFSLNRTSGQRTPHRVKRVSRIHEESAELTSLILCRIHVADSTSLRQHIRHLLEVERVRLIEYRLSFLPFPISNATSSRRALSAPSVGSCSDSNDVIWWRPYKYESRWSRVTGQHGLTLLSLGFNYVAMSIMTFMMGVEILDVTAVDEPRGCLEQLDDCRRLTTIQSLMLHDFQDSLTESISGNNRVCHRAVVNESGQAVFRNRCCTGNQRTGLLVCQFIDARANLWLSLLRTALFLIKCVAFFFGPLILSWTVLSTIEQKHTYVVTPKQPIAMTATLIAHNSRQNFETCDDIELEDGSSVERISKVTEEKSDLSSRTRHIDLTSVSSKKFPKLRQSLRAVQNNALTSSPHNPYNSFCIVVDHRDLVPEHTVPIGVWRCLADAVFGCRLSLVEPFRSCCRSKLFRPCRHSPALCCYQSSKIAPVVGKQNRNENPSDKETAVACEHRFARQLWTTAGAASIEMNDEDGSRCSKHLEQSKELYDANLQCRTSRKHRTEAACGLSTTWRQCLTWVGLSVFATIIFPMPFYARLIIFYYFENAEVNDRKLMAASLHLTPLVDHQMLHYFSPTHPLFVCIYLSYIVTVVVVALNYFGKQWRLRDIDTAAVLDVPCCQVTSPPLLIDLIQASFDRLHRVSWIEVLRTVTANCIWPFQRFGLLGLPIALIYVPVVVPLTVVVSVAYSLPLIHLIATAVRRTSILVRTIYRSRNVGSSHNLRSPDVQLLPEMNKFFRLLRQQTVVESAVCDTVVGSEIFEIETILRRLRLEDRRLVSEDGDDGAGTTVDSECGAADENSDDSDTDADQLEDLAKQVWRRRTSQFAFHVIDRSVSVSPGDKPIVNANSLRRRRQFLVTSSLIWHIFLPIAACLLFTFVVIGLSLIISECVWFAAEVAALSGMGIVANAEQLMKYFFLALLLTVYIRDCFLSVHLRYLDLNRVIFAELRSRLPEFEDVTGLPSILQVNTAFKSSQKSDEADTSLTSVTAHESATAATVVAANVDRITPERTISNIVLLVDRNDKPRIPRKLFDLACEIKGPGAPGPVYAAYLAALQRLLFLLAFIFFICIVVLSFGEVYRVSSTNQTLATLAGGLAPILVRIVRQRARGSAYGGGSDDDDYDTSTLSFRCRLNETIDNFRDSWSPVSDFSFKRNAETLNGSSICDLGCPESVSDLGARATNEVSVIGDEIVPAADGVGSVAMNSSPTLEIGVVNMLIEYYR